MPKALPERLVELSLVAREAAEAVTAARDDTRDSVVALRDQTRAAVAAAADRVDEDLDSVRKNIPGQWSAMTKIAAEIERLKVHFANAKTERDIERAADRAARLKAEAAIAIDYAIASIEDAKLAALDAVIADIEATRARPH